MKNKKHKKVFFNRHRKNILIIGVIVLCLLVIFISEITKEDGQVSSIDFSNEMEERISRMVAGYPIEEMAPFISKQDRRVAAFLIAIAKKESNWGKFSPKKDGKECYNYWGYRGYYNRTESGYSCFDSPEQAVNQVGERVKEFVDDKINTPKKMVVAWKCGFDCSGHSFWSVKKWEWDVSYYYNKIYN